MADHSTHDNTAAAVPESPAPDTAQLADKFRHQAAVSAADVSNQSPCVQSDVQSPCVQPDGAPSFDKNVVKGNGDRCPIETPICPDYFRRGCFFRGGKVKPAHQCKEMHVFKLEPSNMLDLKRTVEVRTDGSTPRVFPARKTPFEPIYSVNLWLRCGERVLFQVQSKKSDKQLPDGQVEVRYPALLGLPGGKVNLDDACPFNCLKRRLHVEWKGAMKPVEIKKIIGWLKQQLVEGHALVLYTAATKSATVCPRNDLPPDLFSVLERARCQFGDQNLPLNDFDGWIRDQNGGVMEVAGLLWLPELHPFHTFQPNYGPWTPNAPAAGDEAEWNSHRQRIANAALDAVLHNCGRPVVQRPIGEVQQYFKPPVSPPAAAAAATP